ncbi:MAG: hypothetical protein L3J35_01735 [Bacteroidales bacterium]|nr:hypothetical protein [Bacteroidales bacterium]
MCKIINTKYIDEISQKKEFKKKIFNLFKQNVSEFEKVMIAALNKEDYELLADIVHKAKSSIKIMGMDKQADDMKILESDLKEKRNKDIYSQKVNVFIKSCQVAVEEIKILEIELNN